MKTINEFTKWLNYFKKKTTQTKKNKNHEKTLAFTKSLYYNLDIFALKKDTGDFLEHYFTNNENLRSELRTIKYEVKGVPFSFLSDNGVFSKDEIDYGSIVLVNSILKNTNNDNLNILDVGCGYGFIGISLSKL